MLNRQLAEGLGGYCGYVGEDEPRVATESFDKFIRVDIIKVRVVDYTGGTLCAFKSLGCQN